MTIPSEIPPPQKAEVYDTPEKIELFKRRTLAIAIRMQARGVTFGRLPRTALQVLRADYDLNYRTARAAIPAVTQLVRDQEALVAELEKSR